MILLVLVEQEGDGNLNFLSQLSPLIASISAFHSQ